MAISQYLITTVQEHFVGLPCDCVLEIVQHSRVKITQVPGLKPPLTSTILHRGVVVPVLELRTLLERPTFETEMIELEASLAAHDQDHIAWLEELRECSTSGRPFTKDADPHMCEFGKWYDTLVGSEAAMTALCGSDRTLHQLVAQLDAPHKAIHSVAKEAMELSTSGKSDEALALVENAVQGELAQMRALFKQLIEGVTESRQSLYVVMHIGGEALAIVVDGVREIVVMDDKSLQPVPMACDFMRGVLPEEGVGNVLILDLDQLLGEPQLENTSATA